MKTSVYLTADDDALLERLATREGRSRASVIRLALEEYAREHGQPRTFHLDGNFEGDGRSIADFTQDEMDELDGRVRRRLAVKLRGCCLAGPAWGALRGTLHR